MSKLKVLLLLALTFLIYQIDFAEAETTKAYYFYFQTEEHDFTQVDSNKVELLDISDGENRILYHKYLATFDVPDLDQTAPILFSGRNYYVGDDITTNISKIGNENTLAIEEKPIMLYFYSDTCSFCLELKPTIEAITDIYIVKYNMDNSEILNLTRNYADKYNTTATSPLIIAGSKAFHSLETIEAGLASGEIKEQAWDDTLVVDYELIDLSEYQGVWGFFLILGAGLIDGINPCAIAMLVIFISLIFGMSGKRRTLISVALSFIIGMYITYFSLGAFLMKFLGKIQPLIKSFSIFIYLFIIIISVIFLTLNLHDFFVTRKKQYGKIKNQLPKGIQKFNKKIMKYITEQLENKNLIVVYLFAFGLGVIISLTEFLCTGQVYLPVILILADNVGSLNGILVLALYNLMFVLPLIIIMILAVVSQSVMKTSDTVRKNLPWIKLITSGLFMIFAIYYIVKLIEVI